MMTMMTTTTRKFATTSKVGFTFRRYYTPQRSSSSSSGSPMLLWRPSLGAQRKPSLQQLRYTCASCSMDDVRAQRIRLVKEAIADKNGAQYVSLENMNRVLDVSSHFDLRKICRTSYYDDIAEDLTQEDFFRYDITGAGHVILSNFRPHLAITTHKANFLNDYCILPPAAKPTSADDLLASVVVGSWEDRALGAVLGMVVGDAVGAPLEFLSAEERASVLAGGTTLPELLPSPHYGLLPGQWTDAASTGLCVLDTLLENPEFSPVDFQVRIFNWWYFGYNNSHGSGSAASRKRGIDGSSVGLDESTHDALLYFMDWGFPPQHPDRHDGEDDTLWSESEVPAAVARVAPIAVRYAAAGMRQALGVASKQALVTHFGTCQASTLSQYVCVLVCCGLTSASQNAQEVLARFQQTGSADPLVAPILQRRPRGIDWTHPVALASGMNAEQQVAAALHCVYSSSSFADAVAKALAIPGDTSTLGSLVGQLAGAIYGVSSIPASWLAAVHSHDQRGTIIQRTRRLLEIARSERVGAAEAEAEGEGSEATSLPQTAATFSRDSRVSVSALST